MMMIATSSNYYHYRDCAYVQLQLKEAEIIHLKDEVWSIKQKLKDAESSLEEANIKEKATQEREELLKASKA